MEKSEIIEKELITTYRKNIWSKFAKAVSEYDLIQENDKIAVCMSGGKDSSLLAKCMQEIQKHGKRKFELVFLVMNPGYTEKNKNKIIENSKLLNIPITIFETDIFERVTKMGGRPCYICARMRRGFLYRKAKELGCNKIALGHHFNDVIETVLMSTFYAGEFKTMLPKLKSTNVEGMELIRPLYYVKEDDIITWKDKNELQFLQCACKFTEEYGKDETDSKRYEIKQLIKDLKLKYDKIDMNIFKSTQNVNLDTILSYRSEKKQKL